MIRANIVAAVSHRKVYFHGIHPRERFLCSIGLLTTLRLSSLLEPISIIAI